MRLLAQQFDRNRALTGDDVRVVIGRDENLAALEGGFAGADLGVEGVTGDATERNRKGAQFLYFASRGSLRQIDGGGDIELGGGVGHGQRVVAGGGGHDAACALLRGEAEQLVGCAAELE